MKNQDYGVRFVGYSAEVAAWRGNGPQKNYAALDFVSGAASIYADEGFVLACNRGELAGLVSTLPEKMKAQVLPQGIHLYPDRPNISKDRFVRQITRRFVNIEHLLEQAEEIGRTIKRRPYSEYIDEIAATGCARVEHHASGLQGRGKLVFRVSSRSMSWYVRPSRGLIVAAQVPPADLSAWAVPPKLFLWPPI
jgi:hypothetical protein